MEKEFVNYNDALSLKELGFDEPCFDYYIPNKNYDPISKIFNSYELGNHNSNTNTIYKNGIISRPLYQQAFRWFREKYRLESSIQRMPPEVYGKGKGDIKNYLLYIWAENLNPRRQRTLHFDTYEEAELACLKKLIEIVKNK